MRKDLFWLITRILTFIAFLGFVIVGILFTFYPNMVTGSEVSSSSALWHSLSLAFMATVSVLALIITINPRKYLDMLLPLFIGKLISSASSLYWYTQFNSNILMLNIITDGFIAIVTLIIYVIAKMYRL